MSDGMATLVGQLGRPRVLVVGDLILDRFVWGAVDRISPEAPIQILAVDREESQPGGAANVARNLAALKAKVTCVGVTGKDAWGSELHRVLRREGVRSPRVVDKDRPTPLKTRMIAHHQQVLRVDRERVAPVSGAVERELIKVLRREAAASDIVVLSDYHKGTLTPKVCRELLQVKVPVLVGLKGREEEKYVGATAASLNRAELAALSGTSDLEQGARKILRKLKLQFLIATLGDRGISVWPAKGEPVRLPAAARQVYDVTGAGDTALAAFALAYAGGTSLARCAELANAAAANVVGKVGTATVTREELQQDVPGPRKVVSENELVKRLDEERSRGRRVVFTNGCFDLLHAGHIQLLEFAKSKGDVLVLAINNDASVRRLKGKNRPILKQEDRGAVMGALEYVDYVVFFGDATPGRLIRKVRPDVLVKGQDYRKNEVVGADFVESIGGRVELAPLDQGKSTSALVKRIRNRG